MWGWIADLLASPFKTNAGVIAIIVLFLSFLVLLSEHRKEVRKWKQALLQQGDQERGGKDE
jgi:hypothetical protein